MEKAARGGLNGQRFPWGNTISESRANYIGDTNDYSYDLGPNGFNTAFTNGVTPYTSPVGYFAPNNYGLYDMAGNLDEWCWDWYGKPYGQPTTNNPTGPTSSPNGYRVLRGGEWNDPAYSARCANRIYKGTPTVADQYIGFRCVKGQ
jgi:formylglycine-generating enzyme required for sulfatase activity